MKLGTIATTTMIISLGLAYPLSAEDLENASQTLDNDQCRECELKVTDTKDKKATLGSSNIPSANSKQLIFFSNLDSYYSPDYWSWSLVVDDLFYLVFDNLFYRDYSYYPSWGYGDRYYWGENRYRDNYSYYYSPDQIRQIYLEVLGREPDYRGLRTWLGVRRSGDSLGDIRRDISRSDEAVSMINQIYREVLGRNADRDGIRTWTNRLASGASLSEIRREIENSPEARDRRYQRYPRYYNPPTNYSTPRNVAPVYSPPTYQPRNIPRVFSPPANYQSPVRYPARNYTQPGRSSTPRNVPRVNSTFSPPVRNLPSRNSSSENESSNRRNSRSRFNSPATDSSPPAVPAAPPQIQR